MVPKIVIGICAYNEEHNINFILHNLIFEQHLPSDYKIIVVCSGCTDRTTDIVKKFQTMDTRVKSIVEETRKGKPHALNLIFDYAKDFDILVLVNADALPENGSITNLVSHIKNSDAGAVFAQPVPFQGPTGVSYEIVKSIWRMHHYISLLKSPKLTGELCAIKTTCLQPIPENIATDEPYIELSIRKQGYPIYYVPSAIIRIRCPTNVSDLFEQRRRIWIGHLQLKQATGFSVSTSSFGNILQVVTELKFTEIFYALLGSFIEVAAYSQAKFFSKNKVPYIWKPIKSTKISTKSSIEVN